MDHDILLHPLHAVLWDIDGTLADGEPLHDQSFDRAAAELDLIFPASVHERLLGISDLETHAWLVQELGLAVGLDQWCQMRFRHYLSDVAHGEALDLWHSFERKGLPQATVSNSDRIIVQANLERLGLLKPGMVSVTVNDVCQGKPHPEPYLRAAHLLGIEPRNCAAVEDSLTGARAAEEAGMQVYVMPWFNGPQAELGFLPISALAERVFTIA